MPPLSTPATIGPATRSTSWNSSPGYLRGHLSRFGVLYSTGRESFSVGFPGDPSALALPLNTGLAIRGEQSTESTWQSTPGPLMLDFRVEPRSLAMYRAEQMVSIDGPILLQEGDQGTRTLSNRLGLDLHDAVLVASGDEPGDSNRYYPLGSVVRRRHGRTAEPG